MLVTDESVTKRKKLLRLLNANCGCGKTLPDDHRCCTTQRCSCVAASKQCSSRCRCKQPNCHNSTEGQEKEQNDVFDHSNLPQISEQTEHIYVDQCDDQDIETETQNEVCSQRTDSSKEGSILDLTCFSDEEAFNSDTDIVDNDTSPGPDNNEETDG